MAEIIRKIAETLHRSIPSSLVFEIALAVLVGLISGAGVWLFKQGISLAHLAAFDWIGAPLTARIPALIFLIPLLGGLFVGVMVYLFVGEERHHGVAGIIESVALAGGRLRYGRMPVKAVCAAVSIGFGASVGPEDPSVQIGANIGSFFGQRLKLTEVLLRTLVAAGAAGGIAAAFNAPIAGIFFAVEIILGELTSSVMGLIVLSAVTASVFTQAVSGAHPAFSVPQKLVYSIPEIPLYILLGLLCGPISALYIRTIDGCRSFFKSLALPAWLKPAVAGLVVGSAGIFLPQVFGVGYETIDGIMAGAPISVRLLLVLVAGKLILTAVSVGGGFQGGVFAPALFLGACFGASFGAVGSRALPGLALEPAAYAMIGMAAVLAGTIHAPLTAILLLFEMTNDYRMILPVMLAVVISLVISKKLQNESVYEMSLVQKGIRLVRGRVVDVLENIRVDEVMQKDAPCLHEADSLSAAEDIFIRTRKHGLPVLDERDCLVGMLTIQDVDAARESTAQTVGEVCARDLIVARPAEPLNEALARMSMRDLGRLPVVEEGDSRRLAGMLHRADVIHAYHLALTKRGAQRYRAHQARLGLLTGVTTEEIRIQPDAACAGKKISEVRFPANLIIASIRRHGTVMIPDGTTVLSAGDELVVVCDGHLPPEMLEICKGPPA